MDPCAAPAVTGGRARRPGAQARAGTRRIRVVRKTDPFTGETCVASAYPIP